MTHPIIGVSLLYKQIKGHGYHLYWLVFRNSLDDSILALMPIILTFCHPSENPIDVQLCQGEEAYLESYFANLEKVGEKEISLPNQPNGAYLHEFYAPLRPWNSVYAWKPLGQWEKIYSTCQQYFTDYSRFPHDPFQTLIACILSLRTRDPVTHAAANRLFAIYPDADRLAQADPETVAQLIYPVGMYRQKAKLLIQLSQILQAYYHGQPPPTIEELVQLPGVGRKTANLVRSFAYHLPAICVDTHVHRIANRLGLVRTKTPEETEYALRILLPDQYWCSLNPLWVQLGQQFCTPLAPRCMSCPIQEGCAYDQVFKSQSLLNKLQFTHPCLKLIPPSPRPFLLKPTSPFEKHIPPRPSFETKS